MGHDLDQESFEKLWQCYPKKVAKAEARKAWAQLMKKKIPRILDLCISAVAEQKKTAQWQNVQFIPHLATWIRGERWEDSCDCSIPANLDSVWEAAQCSAKTSRH